MKIVDLFFILSYNIDRKQNEVYNMTKNELFKELIPDNADREELINLCKAFLRHYYKAENNNYHMKLRDFLERTIQQLAWMNDLDVNFNKNYPDKITFVKHYDKSKYFRVDALVGNIIEE